MGVLFRYGPHNLEIHVVGYAQCTSKDIFIYSNYSEFSDEHGLWRIRFQNYSFSCKLGNHIQVFERRTMYKHFLTHVSEDRFTGPAAGGIAMRLGGTGDFPACVHPSSLYAGQTHFIRWL